MIQVTVRLLTERSLVDEVGEIIERREPWYRAVADVVVSATDSVESVQGTNSVDCGNWSESSSRRQA